MHLQLKPNGQFKPCCRFNHKVTDQVGEAMLPFNIEKKSFSETLNSEFWDKLRKDMLSGKSIPGCWKCDRDDNKQKYSMRFNANRTWNENNQNRPTVENVSIPIKYLELTTGRLCNLKCRTCSSDLSTSWDKDDEELEKKFSDRKCYSHLPKTLDLKVDSGELDELRLIKMTGGEPMLSPSFIPFVDNLISKKISGHVNLEIYTNASWVPKKSILDRLNKFHLVNVFLSIDGVGELNDYVRYPSKWKDVDESTDAWLAHSVGNPDFSIVFSPTISIYNVSHLLELFTWWQNKLNVYFGSPFFIRPSSKQVFAAKNGEYIFPISLMSPTLLQSPSYLTPRLIPRLDSVYAFRKAMIDRIDQSRHNLRKSNFENEFLSIDEYEGRIRYTFDHIVDHVSQKIPDQEKTILKKKCLKLNDSLDELRSQIFSEWNPFSQISEGV